MGEGGIELVRVGIPGLRGELGNCVGIILTEGPLLFGGECPRVLEVLRGSFWLKVVISKSKGFLVRSAELAKGEFSVKPNTGEVEVGD